MIEDTPNGWTEIETADAEQQLQAFQRRSDGLVVSIEKWTSTVPYSAVTLPENFRDDNQVIDRVHDARKLREVEARATRYMEENP